MSGLCPLGLIPFEGKCYKFSTDKKTWDDANAACKKINGNAALAITDYKDVNHFIHKQASPFPTTTALWIGLSSKKNEGTFVWVNGNELHAYQNWAENEPSKPIDGQRYVSHPY